MFTHHQQHRKSDRKWIEKVIQQSFKKLKPEILSKIGESDGLMDKAINIIFEVSEREIEKEFIKNRLEILREHKMVAGAFRRSHNKIWKKPIDLLEMWVFMNLEFHEKLFITYNKKRKNDTRFKVLMALHGKCLLHSFEILELLKGGFADGAMGRWRSLYETVIKIIFLSENDDKLCQQFLDHSVVQEYKDAVEFQKNCSHLGYKPYTSKEMDYFLKSKENMSIKYGNKFAKEYGWLLGYLPEPFNFKEIEKNTHLNHFRSYYKLASQSVHSGPKSTLFSMGSLNSKRWMPSGPSNFGLADPGKNTVYALFWGTAAIAKFDEYLETSVFLKISSRFIGEIGDAFFLVQDEIEESEKLLSKRRRKSK